MKTTNKAAAGSKQRADILHTKESRITELDDQGRFMESYLEYRGIRPIDNDIDVNMRIGKPFLHARRF